MMYGATPGQHDRDAVKLIARSEEVIRRSRALLSRSAGLLARAAELSHASCFQHIQVPVAHVDLDRRPIETPDVG